MSFLLLCYNNSMIKRTETRPIKVGDLQIGNQNKVIIQSMTNTLTKDVQATVQQINQLAKHGCQIVRLAVLDQGDAKAIKEIKKQVSIPLVADIHFDYRLALTSIDSGIDKVRINPGNIGSIENVKKVVDACKEKNIPIRIGVNSGSLDKDILAKYGKPTAEALVESAKKHIQILEELDFYDICLSIKSSDPKLCIETYKLASESFKYPLHLGVTEAGSLLNSAIRSSVALGTILSTGIGDTIRVSVSGDPIEEMKVVKELLSCFNLIDNYPQIISCPTCGRTMWNMLDILPAIEQHLATKSKTLKVAIMGCVVNGPGEAKEADIGIAGGEKEAILFKKGQIIRKIKKEDIIEELIKEIDLITN